MDVEKKGSPDIASAASRLVDAYTAGVFTPAELKGYRADIETRRKSLLAQQAEAQAKLDAIGEAVNHVEALLGYCARVRQGLQTFDAAEKRRAFEALDIRVSWIPGQPLKIQGAIRLGSIAPIPPGSHRRCSRACESRA